MIREILTVVPCSIIELISKLVLISAHLFLSQVDKSKPVVIELDGYAVNKRPRELSRLLNCNQIMVEH